jgi:predicted enzyme related to lactoylglutathione lyase
MLKRIDCVMLKVADLDKATEYYSRVMGLQLAWRDATMAGFDFPGALPGVGELVLTNDPNIPVGLDVNYLVDSVNEECVRLVGEGCDVIAGPFPIAIGSCAVIRDPFGNTLTLVDMTKGPRPPQSG